jgi:hypothetical protein
MEILDSLLREDIRSSKLSKELALQASTDSSILVELAKYFFHDNKKVRAAVTGTFAELSMKHPDMAIPYIDKLIKAIDFPEPQTKWESIQTLGNIAVKDPTLIEVAIPQICEFVNSKSVCVHCGAVGALGQIGEKTEEYALQVLPYVEHALEIYATSNATGFVIDALGKIGKNKKEIASRIIPSLLPFLDDSRPSVSKKAKKVLKSFGYKNI